MGMPWSAAGQTDSYGNPRLTRRPPRSMTILYAANCRFCRRTSRPGTLWGELEGQTPATKKPFPAHTLEPPRHRGRPCAGILSATRPVGGGFRLRFECIRVHYPLDVIGGRILATYVTAQTPGGQSAVSVGHRLPANLASLSQAMQGYLDGSPGQRRQFAVRGGVRRQRCRLAPPAAPSLAPTTYARQIGPIANGC